MIFEVSYSFLTGLVVSGVAFYHYRNTIVPNLAWMLFKIQAIGKLQTNLISLKILFT